MIIGAGARSRYILPGAGAGAGAAEQFYSEPEPEPEPECFPGAGAEAGADQKCHGSASLISRDTKLQSRIFNILKSSKNFQYCKHFFLFKIVPPQNQHFQKTAQHVRWKRLMNRCTKFQADIFKNGCYDKNLSKQAFFTWFRDFTAIFRFFFIDFATSKSVLESFFALFVKIWPENMYHSSKSRKFVVWPFFPGDWDSLDLVILWSQSIGNDTYKCQRHYPCRFVGFVWA